MTLPVFLQVLTTASSEVSNKTLFRSRSTRFTPDLFFIIFYFTLFLLSGLLDISFAFCAIFIGEDFTLSGIFLGIIIISGIFEFTLDSSTNECLPNLKINKFFRFFISITGFFAVLNSFRLCTEMFLTTMKTTSASTSKCFSLPKLLILPIFILQRSYKDALGLLGGILIILNMIVFSFTIAITFPLRNKPRVFISSICVPFSAFNKFMAAMSSCSVILAVFATVFKSIHYYALVVPLFRWFIWAWPCWKTLQSQISRLSIFGFSVYFFVLTFFSSFIYIHPFEGIGKLYYYIFYFLEFLEEIIVIYMFTEVSLDHVTSYLVFRVVTIGFLSTFGLSNILHKWNEEWK